jgi:hypothetical protein
MQQSAWFSRVSGLETKHEAFCKNCSYFLIIPTEEDKEE